MTTKNRTTKEKLKLTKCWPLCGADELVKLKITANKETDFIKRRETVPPDITNKLVKKLRNSRQKIDSCEIKENKTNEDLMNARLRNDAGHPITALKDITKAITTSNEETKLYIQPFPRKGSTTRIWFHSQNNAYETLAQFRPDSARFFGHSHPIRPNSAQFGPDFGPSPHTSQKDLKISSWGHWGEHWVSIPGALGGGALRGAFRKHWVCIGSPFWKESILRLQLNLSSLPVHR